jgi:hypothetical protein
MGAISDEDAEGSRVNATVLRSVIGPQRRALIYHPPTMIALSDGQAIGLALFSARATLS